MVEISFYTYLPFPSGKLANFANKGTRKEYIKIAIPLYEASIRGDWTAAQEILDKRPELVRYSITANNETALHVAASAKSTEQAEEFVKNLMTKMKKEDLELKNSSSNTALCLAAAAGNVKIVGIMVERNRALVAITGAGGMTPLYMATLFGHYETAKCLYGYSQNLRDDCWAPLNRGWLLQKCVENDMFDIALEIVKEYPDLGLSGSTVLGVLAKKTDTTFGFFSPLLLSVWTCFHPKVGPSKMESKANALELLNIIWGAIAEKPTKEIDNIIRGQPDPIEKDDKPASDTDRTLQLLQKISENTAKKHDESGNTNKEHAATTTNNTNVALQESARPKYSSRILFVAAKMGNTRFIIELIRLYPDIIWKVNGENQSIFHTAVKHRHEGIYSLLYEIGSMKDLITPLKDKNDNNMLHLVGKSAKKRRLEDVSGVAFQMQRELLWFKEVEEMIPPYRERKNKDGLTPHELFTKEHKDLVKQGEDWMKDTASQCMVVATLIATIVFAAAFTVPGGYNQDNGIPMFFEKVAFIIFVVSDAISLFSSSASILMFLSILTSRYAERDFQESLPKKLMVGLATLFLSITTMMIAFSVSFFVLYHNKLKWIPILITFFSALPVILYATLQFSLLKDVFFSTYTSRYLFCPKKHILYDENCKRNRRWFQITIPFISRCTTKISKLL
ncbi:uncharacterized protein LOC111902595 [Lactuca sativa]|uniref:uncharacterized protein LOC111902595 n=1 Tax=Lactuca sativa TaxID=4236 RepID=UPI000CD8B127|nr:uncharacterized protein LOC111902595 [Lactuca sativa]